MRYPALWIVAALSAGILLGRAAGFSPRAWLMCAGVALLAALLLLRRGRAAAAWGLTLAVWGCAGALGITLESGYARAESAALLADAGALDLSEPLRWRGVLSSDPVKLPWGARFEVELEEVEVAGRAQAIRGGLRATYFAEESRREDIPAVRAGERVELLLRARRPRNYMNPGSIDLRTQLARQGGDLVGTLRSMELLRKIGEPRMTLETRFARARGSLLARAKTLFEQDARRHAVLRAMLLGDHFFLDREVSEAFQKTAVYHVLVLSGLHMAALAAAVWWIARMLRLPEGARATLTLLVLCAFVGIVEDRPPIERAAWMTSLVIVSRLLYRRTPVVNSVAVAALLLLCASPGALFDASFQLSFLAAAMIAGVALPCIERTSGPYRRALEHLGDETRDLSHPPRAAQFRLDLRALAEWLAGRLPARASRMATATLCGAMRGSLRAWELMLVSCIVQFGMFPAMAELFHRVSLAGPVANAPAAALSVVIIPVGFLSLLSSLVWQWPGEVLARIADGSVSLLMLIVERTAEWSWGNYRIPGPGAALLWTFYLLLAALVVALLARQARRWHALLLIPLAGAAALCAAHPFAAEAERAGFTITMLDVGQGDAIFVTTPGGATLLVDGGGRYGATRMGGMRTGPEPGEQVVSPYLWSRGLKRVDVVALTHAHSDHLDGLHAVLDNFEVGEVWYGRETETAAFRGLLEHARRRGAKIVQRRRGDEFELGGVRGRVLWPEASQPAARAENDDSLVLRLEAEGGSALLTGDIERAVEAALVARGDHLQATFLKVPHHASRTSSTEAFLAAARPRFAAASFGADNTFGYPHCDVLARIGAAGARLERTDRDGAVTFTARNGEATLRRFADTARQAQQLALCAGPGAAPRAPDSPEAATRRRSGEAKSQHGGRSAGRAAKKAGMD
jgi:competence protein ComEC